MVYHYFRFIIFIIDSIRIVFFIKFYLIWINYIFDFNRNREFFESLKFV